MNSLHLRMENKQKDFEKERERMKDELEKMHKSKVDDLKRKLNAEKIKLQKALAEKAAIITEKEQALSSRTEIINEKEN